MSDTDLPELRTDPARPGIIRFDDDPTAGILAGVKSKEIVRRCNAHPALLAACEAMVKARNPTGYVRAIELARVAIADAK